MAIAIWPCLLPLAKPPIPANTRSFPPRSNYFFKIDSRRRVSNLQKNSSSRTRMSSIGSKSLTDFEIGEDLPEDYADWHPRKDPSERRRAGILLHPTSLPGPNGIGELGQEVFRFLDWLETTGCSVWQAAKRLVNSKGELKKELEGFQRAPEILGWLEDAALFAAIDNTLNAYSWSDWPEPLRDRHLAALEIDIFVAQQFLFQRQWQAVHKYAQKKGIRIMGDMPIYVGGHSADVWANRSQFQLNRRTGFNTFVGGVPPDAFSETGQLWGSPLYDWQAMAREGFSWWIQRMKRAYDLFDEFRIDHFRGLAGYWAVSAEADTAMFGAWKVGPRKALFDAIYKAVGKIDIIAEDLAP